jgi:hypothetical protein
VRGGGGGDEVWVGNCHIGINDRRITANGINDRRVTADGINDRRGRKNMK